MIDIHQIAIQIQMLVLPHLHSSISRLLSLCARWEIELCEECVGCERDLGEGLGGEVRGVAGEDDFLD